MSSKVVSLNIGKVSTMMYRGKSVPTAIDKHPVEERLRLRENGLEGDAVADRKNHGGLHKAVYIYALEDYRYWQSCGLSQGKAGLFGENITTEGLANSEICIGDQIAIHDTVLCATQPRIPCYKLSRRVGRPDFAKAFIDSGRSGIYMQVLQSGTIAKGDDILIIKHDPQKISIRKMMEVYFSDTENYEVMQTLIKRTDLPKDIRRVFRKRLMESRPLC